MKLPPTPSPLLSEFWSAGEVVLTTETGEGGGGSPHTASLGACERVRRCTSEGSLDETGVVYTGLAFNDLFVAFPWPRWRVGRRA